MKPKHLAALFVLALAGSLQALAQAPSVRLGELGDRAVVDARGAKIADIYDVVIDTEEGRAAYLVVSAGMKVVPIAMPSPELAFTADKVELNTTRAKLESLPALDMSALGPRYKRGRDIVGGKLKDQQGGAIGTVKDIIIGLNDGTVANVVVEFDPAKVPGQKGWVALPRSSVKHDGADFVATFNLEDMMPAEKAAAEARAREIARAKAVTVDRDERASQLIGRKIVDAQGKPVGEIADFAIDAAGDRLPYAIVNTGAARLALLLPSKDMKRAGDEVVLAAGASGLVPPPAGATRRASEILGKTLVDYRGKDVGKVRDIVVNLGSGKVHYAVAEFDASWVQGGHLVTVRLPKEDMKVELNALMGAMLFPPNGWPDLNGEQYLANIDNYLKTH
jgi:sporulation protein YlmC with PRC-barrel domain